MPRKKGCQRKVTQTEVIVDNGNAFLVVPVVKIT